MSCSPLATATDVPPKDTEITKVGGKREKPDP